MKKGKRVFYGFEISSDLRRRMEELKKFGFPLTPDMYRSFTETEILKREKLLSKQIKNN